MAGVVFAVGGLQRFQETSADWVHHTLEVENRLARIFSLIQDTETGQRGYLLTGNRSYLVPFADADPQIDPELKNLDRLLSDNPVQQQHLSELRSVTDEKRAELRRVIDLHDAGDAEGALSILRQGIGKALMDRVRDVVALMKSEEDRLLVGRTNLVNRNSNILQWGLMFAALLALGVGVLAVWDLLHYARENQTAYELVTSTNEMLVREAEERDRIAAQLRQSQKMEVIGQLTGGLAHDFNNMLAVIIGNLDLLKRRLANGQSDATRFIDGAIEGADRAAVITRRLLAFSRQQPLTPDAIDANKLISGMTELLRRTLSEEVVLETVLVGGLWRTYIDAHQLENAIVNLAVNARDAMPDGGKLTIETGNAHLDKSYAADQIELVAGQYVLIAISNSGQGMSSETISKAFDPFFTTKGTKGTGLGLSQVYGFVKQSRGHVKIYSEVGEGTTVKMYLPRFTGALKEEAKSPVGAGAIPKGYPEEVILVVEDDERVRRFTVDALRDLNYTVLHVDGPAKALTLLDDHPKVNLLLTDVVMLEMNGQQLAEKALRRRGDLKVIYFTGFTRNAIVHNGILDHGVRLITKPFTIEQLAMKVREVLGPARIDR